MGSGFRLDHVLSHRVTLFLGTGWLLPTELFLHPPHGGAARGRLQVERELWCARIKLHSERPGRGVSLAPRHCQVEAAGRG